MLGTFLFIDIKLYVIEYIFLLVFGFYIVIYMYIKIFFYIGCIGIGRFKIVGVIIYIYIYTRFFTGWLIFFGKDAYFRTCKVKRVGGS